MWANGMKEIAAGSAYLKGESRRAQHGFSQAAIDTSIAWGNKIQGLKATVRRLCRRTGGDTRKDGAAEDGRGRRRGRLGLGTRWPWTMGRTPSSARKRRLRITPGRSPVWKRSRNGSRPKGPSSGSAWFDSIDTNLKKANAATLTNLDARLAAQRDYDETVAKNTLSADDFQRYQLNQLIEDQEQKLQEFGESYRATYDLIVNTTKIKLTQVGAAWVSPGMIPPAAKKAIDTSFAGHRSRHFVEMGQIAGGITRQRHARGQACSCPASTRCRSRRADSWTELKALGREWQQLTTIAQTATIAMAALDVAAAATDGKSRGGQTLSYASKGAKIGTSILPGYGTLVGAGVGAIVGAVKVPPDELEARAKYAEWQH